ncbi:hypothetical protein CEP51_009460 [Fusarium floridanum]|uniref:Uncharacterized protein n=1 Tax=Fusarium floridanum TaxID=1325733 RepID=A0A428RHI0_9HYPO|nr:hypothetical protein CEP51_009460 [Fusarium floridanum]
MGQPEELAETVALSTMPDKDSIVLPNTVLGNCCESTAENDDVGPLCDYQSSSQSAPKRHQKSSSTFEETVALHLYQSLASIITQENRWIGTRRKPLYIFSQAKVNV